MLCTLDFNVTLVLRCNYSINNTKYQRTGIIQYFKVTQRRVRNEFMDSSSFSNEDRKYLQSSVWPVKFIYPEPA